MDQEKQTDVVVIGSGPGGYAAAFRAADLGKKVILIEKNNVLGGVCLNRGCIPSKALLHLAKIINDTQTIKEHGILFNKPKINTNKINKWKESIISQLNQGIKKLADARKIQIIKGFAKFQTENSLIIDNTIKIIFKNCIIATGSKAATIPIFKDRHPRILYSSNALDIKKIPKRMLVIGGGYIGLEMGSIYQTLGSEISVVEFMPNLLPGADIDLVQPLFNRLNGTFKKIYLSTKVIKIIPNKNDVDVYFKNEQNEFNEQFDMILIAIGRRPNTNELNLSNAGINYNENGFIPINEKCQTNKTNIYAIGDITDGPMLAHKATHQGKMAAEVIADLPSAFLPAVIPAVIFTDPEIAWAGPTENELKEQGIKYEKGEFPWIASGRALALDRTEGKTKLLFDPENKKIISAGIVGPNAGDIIGEAILAIEMGADVEDISLSIHPHPTLSETFANAAEVFGGTITDLYPNYKKI